LRAPFYFVGGWAIDLHLGRVTREHHDIDTLVMRRDHLLLHKALQQFSPKKIIPHTGRNAAEPRDDRRVASRRASRAAGASDQCVSGRRIGAGVPSDAGGIVERRLDLSAQSECSNADFENGIPSAVGSALSTPEIVLLFKAKHLGPRDRMDFDHALPALSADARRWLRDAIEKTHPGREWLKVL
jgi:hypothetical protein